MEERKGDEEFTEMKESGFETPQRERKRGNTWRERAKYGPCRTNFHAEPTSAASASRGSAGPRARLRRRMIRRVYGRDAPCSGPLGDL
ncbi:hypothetical protein HPP92_025493 [Vanilla planifolia]|uniref:Uncharacterized protein n=1 Tax=Vanilla planifolia TaxID=51239 RepID=A0A835PJ66_VANPL|nr:hypothetical protein HPP92_025493 [Vanilla planifolia]